MKNFFIGLAVIAGIFALIFVVNEFEIFGIKFWGVRQENARREVFEQTQSYIESRRQEISKYHLEWAQEKDSAARNAIKQTVISDFANFDESKLTSTERGFLYEIRGY